MRNKERRKESRERFGDRGEWTGGGESCQLDSEVLPSLLLPSLQLRSVVFLIYSPRATGSMGPHPAGQTDSITRSGNYQILTPGV